MTDVDRLVDLALASEADAKKADPLPGRLPIPAGTRVLVRPIPVKGITKGGLILTDKDQDAEAFVRSVGKVLAMGPKAGRAKYHDEIPADPEFGVGDVVLYSKYQSNRTVVDGVKLIWLDYEDILGTIPAVDAILRD